MLKSIIQQIKKINKRGILDLVWRFIILIRSHLATLRSHKCRVPEDVEKICNDLFTNHGRNADLLTNEQKRKVIEEADKIIDHYITLFTTRNVKFGTEIDWLADPTLKKRWPKIRWNKINIRNVKFGDVRIVWELNRHKHFVTLGKAYQYTKEVRYYNEFVTQLSSWLGTNPYGTGVNWTSTLEVAMRAISWLWSYFLFKDAPQFRNIETKILEALYCHAEYIYTYRSEGLHPNNHIIGEMSSLYLISTAMPFLDRELKWRKKARKILEYEMTRQVYPNGGDREQALCYHRFVLDLFLQVYIMGKKMGDVFSSNFKKRLEKMIEFLIYVSKQDGHLPMIGDSDNARGLPINGDNGFWKEEDVYCLGAVLFKRSDFKFFAPRYTESAALLLGEKGYEIYRSLQPKKPGFLSKCIENSGFAVMRDSWSDGLYVMFDAGPQGIGKVCGHSHADQLSFVLSAFGKDILIDPGTKTYFFADKHRNYFRSTSAHNTVVINNRSQSVPISNFDWEKIIRSKIIRCHTSDNYDLIDAFHDGYGAIIHRRKLIFLKKKGIIVINDFIYGKKTHKMQLFFHLSPCSKLIKKSNQATVVKSGDVFTYIYKVDEEAELEIKTDFVSYNYGQLIESSTLCYSKTKELPTRLSTIIIVNKNELPGLSGDLIKDLLKQTDNL